MHSFPSSAHASGNKIGVTMRFSNKSMLSRFTKYLIHILFTQLNRLAGSKLEERSFSTVQDSLKSVEWSWNGSNLKFEVYSWFLVFVWVSCWYYSLKHRLVELVVFTMNHAHMFQCFPQQNFAPNEPISKIFGPLKSYVQVVSGNR